MQLSAEDEVFVNDNFEDYLIPSEADQLSWGVGWIDAERVWGGVENARDVVPGNPSGENIKVGIIDSGIDYTHPDLNDNYAGGIDYVNNDADPFDDRGHGTHVAGIVGAEDNDILGVIGVAPKVSLYGIKVLDDNGDGLWSNVIAGIDWAVNNNLDIINLSLGGSSDTSALEEAINRAWDAGIVVVAAARNYDGNSYLMLYPAARNYDGNSYLMLYPAAYEKSIAVANLEPVPSKDNPTSVTRNSGSCIGDRMDVSAPGTFIISTYPSNSYYEANGTSMAAPMVAGTCALLLSVNQYFSPYDVRDILIATAGDLGEPGHDDLYGHGQINAWEAVQLAEATTPSDSDNDGLFDREEMQLGTDRLDSDTDDDGLNDGDELNIYFTNPTIADADKDSDYDGLTNVNEIDTHGTNPFSSDTDGDVMLDPWEVEQGLNPLVDDTALDPDGDGLVNIAEFHNNCDPHDADTDNDGLSDGAEVLTYNTNPWIADTDGDSMPDGWEVANSFDPTDNGDGTDDADGDGLRNFEEYLCGTDPNDYDTDNDGLNDLWEINWGTNPLVADNTADPDGDGLTNEDEQTYETDPFNADSDGDGLDDGLEVALGYDPTDPNSHPGGGGGFFFP